MSVEVREWGCIAVTCPRQSCSKSFRQDLSLTLKYRCALNDLHVTWRNQRVIGGCWFVCMFIRVHDVNILHPWATLGVCRFRTYVLYKTYVISFCFLQLNYNLPLQIRTYLAKTRWKRSKEDEKCMSSKVICMKSLAFCQRTLAYILRNAKCNVRTLVFVCNRRGLNLIQFVVLLQYVAAIITWQTRKV